MILREGREPGRVDRSHATKGNRLGLSHIRHENIIRRRGIIAISRKIFAGDIAFRTGDSRLAGSLISSRILSQNESISILIGRKTKNGVTFSFIGCTPCRSRKIFADCGLFSNQAVFGDLDSLGRNCGIGIPAILRDFIARGCSGDVQGIVLQIVDVLPGSGKRAQWFDDIEFDSAGGIRIDCGSGNQSSLSDGLGIERDIDARRGDDNRSFITGCDSRLVLIGILQRETQGLGSRCIGRRDVEADSERFTDFIGILDTGSIDGESRKSR